MVQPGKKREYYFTNVSDADTLNGPRKQPKTNF